MIALLGDFKIKKRTNKTNKQNKVDQQFTKFSFIIDTLNKTLIKKTRLSVILILSFNNFLLNVKSKMFKRYKNYKNYSI